MIAYHHRGAMNTVEELTVVCSCLGESVVNRKDSSKSRASRRFAQHCVFGGAGVLRSLLSAICGSGSVRASFSGSGIRSIAPQSLALL